MTPVPNTDGSHRARQRFTAGTLGVQGYTDSSRHSSDPSAISPPLSTALNREAPHSSRPRASRCAPSMWRMADEEFDHDLTSLLVIAEDIRDGRRAEPFTRSELHRLCNELKRAIALLGADEGESIVLEGEGEF